ncbi:hypothetical protein B0T17DRAFT_223531 [Bombardia bombarda]|uniref:Uncharacterized protein n=1 Tax=Bombardia bombarda TaxID=252184 RepID=A0AA39XBC9_9PEZI|nr:hypothetical protein B0T17DRAFT_223531 [Bombardia bombarda]
MVRIHGNGPPKRIAHRCLWNHRPSTSQILDPLSITPTSSFPCPLWDLVAGEVEASNRRRRLRMSSLAPLVNLPSSFFSCFSCAAVKLWSPATYIHTAAAIPPSSYLNHLPNPGASIWDTITGAAGPTIGRP